MKFSDMTITINGAGRVLDTIGSCSPLTPSSEAVYLACAGSTRATGETGISAGNSISIPAVNSGETMRILDSTRNAVILTLIVG